MKRIIPAIALALTVFALTSIPAYADSNPTAKNVESVSKVVGSNGKETVIVETDDGSYILPEGMDAPEPDSSIVLYEKDGKIVSWYEAIDGKSGSNKKSRSSIEESKKNAIDDIDDIERTLLCVSFLSLIALGVLLITLSDGGPSTGIGLCITALGVILLLIVLL